jgi:mono/diheme cytochrome c family protein
VSVIQPAAFDRWVRRQRKPVGGTAGGGGGQAGGGGGAAPKGADIFTSNGCNSCHTLAAAKATGTVGPDLDHIKPATAAFIRQSIVDPNKVVTKGFPKDVMPQDFGQKLSAAELDALVKYLLESQR